jgi:ABC-2 type transport system permease protein
MRNVIPIARRELKAYFNSPIAYIVVGVFLLISGYLYFSTVFLAGSSTLRSFFTITPLLLVVFAPAITMRLVAEELRTGTLELLTTMPVRDLEVVAGKFLAALGVMASALVMTLAYAVTIAAIGDLDWGPVVGGYLGLLLVAAALAAVGLATSTWTRNQIVAFILSLLLCLALWLFDKITLFVPEGLGRVLEYLSVDYHFQNIARGVVDSRDLLYYLSVCAVALFVAVRSMQRRHA